MPHRPQGGRVTDVVWEVPEGVSMSTGRSAAVGDVQGSVEGASVTVRVSFTGNLGHRAGVTLGQKKTWVRVVSASESKTGRPSSCSDITRQVLLPV